MYLSNYIVIFNQTFSIENGTPLCGVSDTTPKTWVTRQVQKYNIYLNNTSILGIMYKSKITSIKNKLQCITTALSKVDNMPPLWFILDSWSHLPSNPHSLYHTDHFHTVASTTLLLCGGTWRRCCVFLTLTTTPTYNMWLDVIQNFDSLHIWMWQF